MDPLPQRQTRDNKQLDAALCLCKLTARLLGANLKELSSIFNDDESSKRSKESALRGIKKSAIPSLKHASDTIHSLAPVAAPSAIPFLKHASDTIRSSAPVTAPIASALCMMHQRQESKQLLQQSHQRTMRQQDDDKRPTERVNLLDEQKMLS